MARSFREAAIAGIGQTEFSKESGRSELQLAAECSKAALDDAGIDPSEVDGMITFTIDGSDEIHLARALGVKDLAYTTRIPGGGAAAAATLYQAMAAVNAGVCETVLIWRAMNERSQYRFGQPHTQAAAFQPGNGTGSLRVHGLVALLVHGLVRAIDIGRQRHVAQAVKGFQQRLPLRRDLEQGAITARHGQREAGVRTSGLLAQQ